MNDLPESAGAEAFITSGQRDYKAWSSENDDTRVMLSFPYNLRTAQLLAAVFNPDLFYLPSSGNAVYDDGKMRLRYSHYPWEMSNPSDPQVRRGWELTDNALLEAQRLASDNHAQLIVLFVPSREHVYWPYLQAVLKDVDIHQLDDVEARLAQFCQQHAIAYLNLLPGFREAALQGQILYFPNDGHWNPDGHQLAAHLIYAYLQGLGALP